MRVKVGWEWDIGKWRPNRSMQIRVDCFTLLDPML